MADQLPFPGFAVPTAVPRVAPAPEGFVYVPDFIDSRQEAVLLDLLDGLPYREVRMHGVVARRQVAHFGWEYSYGGGALHAAAPFPPALHELRQQVAALVALPALQLQEALVNRYPPGAGIGWHRDAPMFGPAVVAISLATAATLRLRTRPGASSPCKTMITLAPRSAYVLAGPARSEWEHCLSPVKALRFSLSFRTLKNGPPSFRPADR